MLIRNPLSYLAGAGVLIVIGVGGALYQAQSASAAAAAATVPSGPLTVYWSDGDSGRLSDGTKFRLHGIDSPETGSLKQRGGAKCEAERALGYEAKAAAVTLTRGKLVEVTATHGLDRYDRLVIDIAVEGADVADLLVMAGTHRGWDYDARQKKPDWCASAQVVTAAG